MIQFDDELRYLEEMAAALRRVVAFLDLSDATMRDLDHQRRQVDAEIELYISGRRKR